MSLVRHNTATQAFAEGALGLAVVEAKDREVMDPGTHGFQRIGTVPDRR